MKRFRFKTEQEIRDSNNWVKELGVPKGWGSDKDILKLLGTEITDPKLLRICEQGGSMNIPFNSTLATDYYVEIKQEETMKKYRFKTREEFGKDLPIGWVSPMRGNVGKTLVGLDSQTMVSISQGKNFNYAFPGETKYSYRADDVVEIKEPQRIPKQDWEDLDLNSSICGVEMQNGNKFYLLWNVDGFIPVNLKEHSSTSYSDTSNVENGLASMHETNGNKKLFRFETMKELIEWATK